MKITLDFDIPSSCAKCPFYTEEQYRCHSELVMLSYCSLGFFEGTDTRDLCYSVKNKRFNKCRIEEHDNEIINI